MEGTITQHPSDIRLLVCSDDEGSWNSARGFRIPSTVGYVYPTGDCGIFPFEVFACGRIYRR